MPEGKKGLDGFVTSFCPDLLVLMTSFSILVWWFMSAWSSIKRHLSTCKMMELYFVSVGIGFCLQYSNLVGTRTYFINDTLVICISQSSPQTCHLTSPVVRSHWVGTIRDVKHVIARPGSKVQSKTCVNAPAASCMNWFLTTIQNWLSSKLQLYIWILLSFLIIHLCNSLLLPR